ncbi:MAG: hypothetical protein WCX73_04925 [Candidatus Pacearchaeota archaeon]|jgi:hypothetical protein
MPENFPIRYGEESSRFKGTQSITKETRPSPSNSSSSRYLEYRNREKLALDKIEHPEKYIPQQPKIEVTPELSPMVIEPPVEKKSWFSKLFG